MYQASSPQGLWLSTWSEYLFSGPGRGEEGTRYVGRYVIKATSGCCQPTYRMRNRGPKALEYLCQGRTCRPEEPARKRVWGGNHDGILWAWAGEGRTDRERE